MKKIISLLAIMLIALVAAQVIDAVPTKKTFYNSVTNGVRISAVQFTDPNPDLAGFGVGLENQTRSRKWVELSVYGRKNGKAKTMIFTGSWALNPGETKLIHDDRTNKYSDVTVTEISVKTIK